MFVRADNDDRMHHFLACTAAMTPADVASYVTISVSAVFACRQITPRERRRECESMTRRADAGGTEMLISLQSKRTGWKRGLCV
jgi:hypothetical protein